VVDARNIWDERIADLRRYDLDQLEQEPINPMEVQSWPVPSLTFARVDGILRSWDIEREKQQQQQQQPQNQDPNQPPKRIYMSEDALTGLNAQKANLAYLVLGSKSGVNYYVGMSMPSTQAETNGTEASAIHYQTIKSILHSVFRAGGAHCQRAAGAQLRHTRAGRAHPAAPGEPGRILNC
jgi:hypothetical protein